MFRGEFSSIARNWGRASIPTGVCCGRFAESGVGLGFHGGFNSLFCSVFWCYCWVFVFGLVAWHWAVEALDYGVFGKLPYFLRSSCLKSFGNS